MASERLLLISECCKHYSVEYSFISALKASRLISVIEIDRQEFLPQEELEKMERISRLYHELEINLEGIEAILPLLQKVEELQQEIAELKNRLRLFEE